MVSYLPPSTLESSKSNNESYISQKHRRCDPSLTSGRGGGQGVNLTFFRLCIQVVSVSHINILTIDHVQ